MTASNRGCRLTGFLSGAGPTVVHIQGDGVGATGWAPQIASLSRHYQCFTFDNRGFGASQPLGEPLTVSLMADDVQTLMDALDWRSAHLVGHSLGGLVALCVAQQAPERVRSLALLCTFATGSIPTRPAPELLWIGLRSRVGTRRMRRNAFLELVMPRDLLAAVDRDKLAAQLAELFGHDLADQPPIVLKQFSAMRRGDARSFLRDLGMPAFVMSAEFDIIAPSYAGRELAAGLPNATFVEIEDAAHGVTIQRADRVNELLLEHLRRAEPS